MNCEIISVGTELLTGQILNTNSQFLATQLSELGINVHNITTVGDNPERLKKVFIQALKDNDLIILTGGLGPTEDDLTKETVAEVLDKKLILDEDEKYKLINWFKNRKIPFTENNLKQAYLIENCIKIDNPNGTAPGIFIDENNKLIFLLPGPPGELKELYYSFVKPTLEKIEDNIVISRYYNITDLGESSVEDKLLDLIDNQTNPTIATYANLGEILVRVTANGENAEKLLDQMEDKIEERIGDYIFSKSRDSLVKTIGKYLIENNLTISSAESCTGGMISEKLTDIPGISKSFMLGLVTYANEAKNKVLNVKQSTLDKFGAVSKETCQEMCQNVREILNTDIGVATTGIAGPDGGTKEKPVGLVYTGIATREGFKVKKNLFSGDRESIRRRATNMVFQMLREELLQ